MRYLYLSVLLSLCFHLPTASAVEYSGSVSVEGRYFMDDPQFPGQRDGAVSLILEPEIYHSWDDGYQQWVFSPFYHLDSTDKRRTHFDVRELFWEKAARDWELRVGLAQIFWGVTESVHLVDIINQTDLIENPDGEDKFGQPMVNFSWINNWGTLDLFALPYHRRRSFPERTGRLRAGLLVDQDNPDYESGAQEWHLDWAARWSQVVGDFDIGVSYFSGTTREPRLKLGLDQSNGLVLKPFYELIDQLGVDLQWTHEGWLWKLEAITRDGQQGRFIAAAGGFEYTFVGVAGTNADVGVLSEYLFDDRGHDGPSATANDLFLGARFILNDVDSTEVLAGSVFDLDTYAQFLSVEASRRFGDRWKLNVEARLFVGIPADDPFAALQTDDYVSAQLSWHF